MYGKMSPRPIPRPETTKEAAHWTFGVPREMVVKRPVPNAAIQAPPIIERNTVANLTDDGTGDHNGNDLGEDQG